MTARAVTNRLAAGLAAVGLFTMSWDRLLNLQVASYNVKIPSLVFTLAFVLAVVGGRDRMQALLGRGPRRTIVALGLAVVVYEAVRSAFTPAPMAAAAQVVALLTGAILPAATLLLLVRDPACLRRALRWVLSGTAVAALFGLYQLTAFYLGWPQGVAYTGVGIGTGLGRISAFNYEPAYFAYYLVLALGACAALRRMQGREIGWLALIGFAAMLYLANVRAVPLLAIGLAAVLLLAPRANRRLILRGGVVAVATLVIALAVPVAVTAVTQAQREAVDQGSSRADDPQGFGSQQQESAPRQALQSGLQTVNPDEPSSNGPRLDLYRAVLAEVSRSPITGLGPGQLAGSLRREAPQTVQDQGAGQVVANNIWLQALADGGVPLLLLEVALVAAVALAAFRGRRGSAFPMAAAWLAVVGVGGMLTSYLFDIKVWVVLALLLIGLSFGDQSTGTRMKESAS